MVNIQYRRKIFKDSKKSQKEWNSKYYLSREIGENHAEGGINIRNDGK